MMDNLKSWGCNVDEALERFVDDQDLYMMCMNLFVDDGSFEALETAINDQDYKGAFEASHTLKGVAGNVSATPLFMVLDEITEKLRANNIDGVKEELATIMQLRESLRSALAG